MQNKSEGKKREICLPGDEVGSGELKAGSGTYRDGDKIYASTVGIRTVRSSFVNIIPLVGKYLPNVGDQIIGYITDVGPTYWLLDINSPYPAPLHVNDTPWKVDFGDTSKYLETDNAVIVTISNVDEIKHVQVSMREHGHRKMNTGSIVEISPSRVPRVIGRGGSMINLLKKGTRCRIFVGQNGRIWIDGEPEDMELAIKAVEMIDRESQSFGLTERIKEFLGVSDADYSNDDTPEGDAKSEDDEDDQRM